MAIVIKANGETASAHPKNVKRGFDLDELHQLLGCDCVDIVILTGRLRMVVDDEGARKELAANEMASQLYWASGYQPGWMIRGTVLIGSTEEIQ